jgi:hypothetical protein
MKNLIILLSAMVLLASCSYNKTVLVEEDDCPDCPMTIVDNVPPQYEDGDAIYYTAKTGGWRYSDYKCTYCYVGTIVERNN